MNHDCSNVSPLPVEVKKLQQMNDKLFAQIHHTSDVRRSDNLSDLELRNCRLKGAITSNISPDSSGKSQHLTGLRLEEDMDGVTHQGEIRSISTKSSERGTPTDRHLNSPTFGNPLDYSTHSRLPDTAARPVTRISPAMKSGSSCASYIGSFSSSSSPSPSLPDNCSGPFHHHGDSLTWKPQQTCGSPLNAIKKLANQPTETIPTPIPIPFSNKVPAKRRGRLKKDISDQLNTETQTSINGDTHELNGKNFGTRKPTDSLKVSLKRHNTSGLSAAGNGRTNVTTAAYKYLTWREKDRRRRFREEWKHLWLVIPHGRYEVMCLVCHKVMTQRKLDTIKRHTVRRHVELLGMPETERQNLFEQLVRQHNALGALDPAQSTNSAPMRSGRKTVNELGRLRTVKPSGCGGGGLDRTQLNNLPQAPNVELPLWHSGALDSVSALQHLPAKCLTELPQFSPTRPKKDETASLNQPVSEQTMSNLKHPLFTSMASSLMPGKPSSTHRTVPAEYSSQPKKSTKDSVMDFTSNVVRTNPPISVNYNNLIPTNHPGEATFQDSPFPYPPTFQPFVRSINKFANLTDKFATHQPRENPVTSTFTHILEQLAGPKTRIFGGELDTSSGLMSANADTRCTQHGQYSVSDTATSKSQVSFQGFRTSSKSSCCRDTIKVGGKRSTTPSSHTPSPKYLKTKGDTSNFLRYVDANLMSTGMQPAELNSENYIQTKTPGTLQENPTALVMAAAATAQSLLRIPPTWWPPNMAGNYPHTGYPPFNQEFTPVMMATWAAAMAAMSSNAIGCESLKSFSPKLTPANNILPSAGGSMKTLSVHTTQSNMTSVFPDHAPGRVSDFTSTVKEPAWHLSQKQTNVNTCDRMPRQPGPTKSPTPTKPEPGKPPDLSAFHNPWEWQWPAGSMLASKTVLNETSNAEIGGRNTFQTTFQAFKPSTTNSQDCMSIGDYVPQTTISSGTFTHRGKCISQVDTNESLPERLNCLVCSWENKQKDCIGHTKRSPTELLQHSCPSSSSDGSVAMKEKPKISHDRLFPPTWSGNPEKISTNFPLKSPIQDTYALPSNCDFPIASDIRNSIPFSMPSFRSLPHLPPLTPGSLDASVMMYYGEFLRQHIGVAPKDNSSVHSSLPRNFFNAVGTDASAIHFPWSYKTTSVDIKTRKDSAQSEGSCFAATVNASRNSPTANTKSQDKSSNGTQQQKLTDVRKSETTTERQPLVSQSMESVKVSCDSEKPDEKCFEAGATDRPVDVLSPMWSVNLTNPTMSAYNCVSSELERSKEVELNVSKPGYNGFMIHMLRLGPDQNLRECLSHYVVQHCLTGAFIMTCCGSLRRARLRLATLQERDFEGPFEIVSLVGTLASDGQPHLHIALADSEGRVIGGHLLGDARVHTTAEIVLGITGIEPSAQSPEDSVGRPKSVRVCKDIPNVDETVEGTSVGLRQNVVSDASCVDLPKTSGLRLVRKLDEQTGFQELAFENLMNMKLSTD
ncbi:hypothetical protein EG68_00025 [Paragonimus skrjabini miyazakii]|uniref:PPC domain-containing protein n=1 Tax=Paragonimus skrjabini miyazakii TaxID=59628 RepID=A0A8S9Z5F6_9TREM|nr:hypothetical protein EG68_00025 [Paragonimus skrjabini miyazakii]